jgi:hypothetical protein
MKSTLDDITDIENHIDSVLDNLRIFTLPSHIALFMVLEMYEAILVALPMMNLGYSTEARYRIQMINIFRLRHSLEYLIPRLFNRCLHKAIKINDIKNLRNLAVNSTYQLYARQAINYCQRYSWLAYYITGYRQGWFGCTINGHEITFAYPEDIDIPQSLMHHTVKPLHETMAMDQDLLSEASNEPLRELDEALISALKHKTPEQFLDLIPNNLFQNTKKWALGTIPRPSVNEETRFDLYTVGEFYKFWVSLATLMSCYYYSCRVKHHSYPKQAFKSLVVITSLEEIAELISAKTEDLPIETSKNIAQDLVFYPNVKRPDIQVHCFFPVSEKHILLSPQLIMTTNWEVCLLRNWSNKSPAKYGEIVASKKDRLTDDLASLFNQATIEKAVRKIIIDSNRQPIGDVDLAICDKSTGYLVVVEIKWLIEPDSFQEESHAIEDLHKGIEQLLKIKELATNNKYQLIKNLYPNNEVISDEVMEIQYFLICRGSVSAGTNTLALDIPLLDYQLSYEILDRNKSNNLKMRYQEVIDIHNKIKKNVEDEICYSGLKLAGYLWRIPGGKISSKGMVSTKKRYSNKSFCLCGSGRLYRDCCQVIDTLPEEGVVHPEFG